jgi:multiple sugar transport system permease protein
MTPVTSSTDTAVLPRTAAAAPRHLLPRYRWFIAPALVVLTAVIAFPWAFTIWMSVHEWQIGTPAAFVGLQNYVDLPHNARFIESVGRTLTFTVLAVALPLIAGTFSAVIFHEKFPLRGLLRGIFIMPMMATPVAVALVWAMMFNPDLGVLNYLLSAVGLPRQLWVYSADTVLLSLALVEVWLWTPLVMIIVLGGLAALPTEPYESALLDGAGRWQMFRHITLPLVLPFIMVAVVIRTIDGLKAFDTIYAMTEGGPGTASETINLYLYADAFKYYNVGHASAVVVVFFTIIIALSLILLWARQKAKWT